MARLLKAENLIRLIIEGFEVLNQSLLRNIKMASLQKILKKEDGLSAKKINERKALQKRHVVTSLMTFAPEV